MFKLGIQPDAIHTFNTLINGRCIEGEIKEAVGLFIERVRRRDISLITILHGFCILGHLNGKQPYLGFNEMVGRNVYAKYSDLPPFWLIGLCKEWMVSEARCVFDAMTKKGADTMLTPTMPCMDGYCLNKSKWMRAPKGGRHHGLTGVVHLLYKVTISESCGYCKRRRLDDAKSLLVEMSENELNSLYCHLQHSYARICDRDSSNAFRLIDELVGKRFSADSSTFQLLLDLEIS
ncbi:hypothetical protein NC652_012477 [Populus alba x Populus x berolinensis]|nr:hypothetical protein NC652_012477 [Populus alba x Populus x berolinensis]